MVEIEDVTMLLDDGEPTVIVVYDGNGAIETTRHEFTSKKEARRFFLKVKQWMEAPKGPMPYCRELEFFGGPLCGERCVIVAWGIGLPMECEFKWPSDKRTYLYVYDKDELPESGRVPLWIAGGAGR
jgi:hypothetical protein